MSDFVIDSVTVVGMVAAAYQTAKIVHADAKELTAAQSKTKETNEESSWSVLNPMKLLGRGQTSQMDTRDNNSQDDANNSEDDPAANSAEDDAQPAGTQSSSGGFWSGMTSWVSGSHAQTDSEKSDVQVTQDAPGSSSQLQHVESSRHRARALRRRAHDSLGRPMSADNLSHSAGVLRFWVMFGLLNWAAIHHWIYTRELRLILVVLYIIRPGREFLQTVVYLQGFQPILQILGPRITRLLRKYRPRFQRLIAHTFLPTLARLIPYVAARANDNELVSAECAFTNEAADMLLFRRRREREMLQRDVRSPRTGRRISFAMSPAHRRITIATPPPSSFSPVKSRGAPATEPRERGTSRYNEEEETNTESYSGYQTFFGSLANSVLGVVRPTTAPTNTHHARKPSADQRHEAEELFMQQPTPAICTTTTTTTSSTSSAQPPQESIGRERAGSSFSLPRPTPQTIENTTTNTGIEAIPSDELDHAFEALHEEEDEAEDDSVSDITGDLAFIDDSNTVQSDDKVSFTSDSPERTTTHSITSRKSLSPTQVRMAKILRKRRSQQKLWEQSGISVEELEVAAKSHGRSVSLDLVGSLNVQLAQSDSDGESKSPVEDELRRENSIRRRKTTRLMQTSSAEEKR